MSYLGLSDGGGGKELYQYQPLSGSEDLRLLTLEPGDFGDDLSCTLSVVSSTASPAYEALSYVWGDPTTTHGILNDNKVIGLAANLYTVLKHLRRSDYARTV
jgi:hypothetical protein